MSHSNTFTPGKWLDQIDADDFVQLNKIPFLKAPEFLTPAATSALFTTSWINAYNPSSWRKKNEGKETGISALFERSCTERVKKAIKAGLLPNDYGSTVPPSLFPDFRLIPLYGTRKLIQEKKQNIKQSDNAFQTPEWVEQRLLAANEMDALSHFGESLKAIGLDPLAPAGSAKQCFTLFAQSVSAAAAENPDVPFSLGDVTPFLDIYLEQDLRTKRITEEQAQHYVDTLLTELSRVPFTTGTLVFVFSERDLTKTTYRFLNSFLSRSDLAFPIRFLHSEQAASPHFHHWAERVAAHVPASSFHQVGPMSGDTIFLNGIPGRTGEDLALSAGPIDLLSAFYLSLNGGKDVKTNANLLSNVQPLKQDTIPYPEAMNRFRETLIFVLNLYSSTLNHLFYLSEHYLSHPYRYSLHTSFRYYTLQFSFCNLKPVLDIFSSLQAGRYSVIRNEKNWIECIECIPGEETNGESEAGEAILAYLKQQIERLPHYKDGKPLLQIMDPSLPAGVLSPSADWNIPCLLKEWPEDFTGYWKGGYRDVYIGKWF